MCSDHAPHCDYEKEVEFDYAPFGITGLETELALSLMQLVHTKRLSLADLIAKFTVNPARLLNLNKGTLSVGADADVTVFDPDCEWIFSARKIPRANRRTARSSAGSSKARPWPPLSAGKKSGRNRPKRCRRENFRFTLDPLRRLPSIAPGHESTMKAILALEDGSVFHGQGFGARASACGEVCFNTSMTGYQEILTDPSYKGQIVTMTYPLIGNYGVNAEDVESWRPHVGRLRHPRTFAGRQQLARGFFARGISGEKRHSRHPGH